jgi:hypothetical protein
MSRGGIRTTELVLVASLLPACGAGGGKRTFTPMVAPDLDVQVDPPNPDGGVEPTTLTLCLSSAFPPLPPAGPAAAFGPGLHLPGLAPGRHDRSAESIYRPLKVFKGLGFQT